MEQNERPRFRADLFISYFANGQKHFSKRKTAKKNSRAAVKAEIEHKYPNKKITLYFNPHSPKQSVFEPGTKSYWLLAPVLAAFLLYVGMISYSWPFTGAILIVAIAGGLVVLNFFVAFGGYYYPDADVWDEIQQWLETYMLGPPPISPYTISSVRRRSGRASTKPKMSKQPPKPAQPVSQMTTKERNAEMARLYNQGTTIDSIARQFNMTRFAVMVILRSQRRASRKHSSEEGFRADIAEIEQDAGIPSQEPVKVDEYFCRECGAKHRSTAKFCARCGTRTSRKEPFPTQLETPSDEVFTEEPAADGVAESAAINRAPPVQSLGLVGKPGIFTPSCSVEITEQSLPSPIPESTPKATTPDITESAEIATLETIDQPREPSMEPIDEEKESWASSIQYRFREIISGLGNGLLGISAEDTAIESTEQPVPVEPLMEPIDAEKQSLFSSIRYRVREIIFEPDDDPTIACIVPYSGSIKQIMVTFNQNQVFMSGCLKHRDEVSVNLELAVVKELERTTLADPWKEIALSGDQDIISAIKLRRGIARRMISLGEATALTQSPSPGEICLQVISNESEDAISQSYELFKDLQSFFDHSRFR